MPGDWRSWGSSTPAGSPPPPSPFMFKIHLLLPNIYFSHQSMAISIAIVCCCFLCMCVGLCVQSFVSGSGGVSGPIELDTLFPLFPSWASH